MTAKPKFKSDAFASIHQSATGLHKVGAITKTTLREFDDACLSVPESFQPKDIKRLREHHHMSQPIFARYLNTTESTVQKWEAGAKRPSGTALKLLSVVQKHGLEVLA
jgi:putative transcriptional regulator